MTSSLPNPPKGDILVVGGTGSIGSSIVQVLLNDGYDVTVMSRSQQSENLLNIPKNLCQGFLRGVRCDVTSMPSVIKSSINNYNYAQRHQSVTGIVYAVGNCPPGGFDQEIAVPLLDLTGERILAELDLHVTGLFNVMRTYCHWIKSHGHVVVIGSAITRLTDARCPPWLHAGHYATAKAAQEELIRWLRRDPYLQRKNILVHRLAPAAVDTPFHQGCEHQPPAMLSVNEVAQRVLDAFGSETIIDEMMIPQPSQ